MSEPQIKALTAPAAEDRGSTYLQYLPAIFQQDGDDGQPLFLGRFLLAFEHLLSGIGDPAAPGLLEVLEGIAGELAGLERYFDPGPGQGDLLRAPAEFLPWLARWVALALREDWEEGERREMISRIVPLYRLRGTKEGLRELLQTYTGRGVEIEDAFDQFPHYFQVRLLVDIPDPLEVQRKERIARAIIDQEKPAHTYYGLSSRILSTMQIGRRSTIGKDTLLGSP